MRHFQLGISKLDIFDSFFIVFKFEGAKTDIDGNTCFDYLEIRNGNSQYSGLLGKYCGDSDVLSLPITMQTTGEYLWLR